MLKYDVAFAPRSKDAYTRSATRKTGYLQCEDVNTDYLSVSTSGLIT